MPAWSIPNSAEPPRPKGTSNTIDRQHAAQYINRPIVDQLVNEEDLNPRVSTRESKVTQILPICTLSECVYHFLGRKGEGHATTIETMCGNFAMSPWPHGGTRQTQKSCRDRLASQTRRPDGDRRARVSRFVRIINSLTTSPDSGWTRWTHGVVPISHGAGVDI